METPLVTKPTGERIAYVDCGTPVCALFYTLAEPAAAALGMEIERIKPALRPTPSARWRGVRPPAAHRHDPARLLGEAAKGAPLPPMRNRATSRMGRHQIPDLGPERDQHLLLETSVQIPQGSGHDRLIGSVDGWRLTGDLVKLATAEISSKVGRSPGRATSTNDPARAEQSVAAFWFAEP